MLYLNAIPSDGSIKAAFFDFSSNKYTVIYPDDSLKDFFKPYFGASAIMVDGEQCLIAGSFNTDKEKKEELYDTIIISLGTDC